MAACAATHIVRHAVSKTLLITARVTASLTAKRTLLRTCVITVSDMTSNTSSSTIHPTAWGPFPGPLGPPLPPPAVQPGNIRPAQGLQAGADVALVEQAYKFDAGKLPVFGMRGTGGRLEPLGARGFAVSGGRFNGR